MDKITAEQIAAVATSPWSFASADITATITALTDEVARLQRTLQDKVDSHNRKVWMATIRVEKMKNALVEAEKHFGPFADITINGKHDPDDVRVVSIIRAALAVQP